MNRKEIRDNRLKWINFLLNKKRKKIKEALDGGDGARCCLGHGAYVLGVPRTKLDSPFEPEKFAYGRNGAEALAPQEFMDMVGLWDNNGSPYEDENDFKFTINGFSFGNLAEANDGNGFDEEASPQEIGAYLLTVIEGGKDTPFKPLGDYSE